MIHTFKKTPERKNPSQTVKGSVKTRAKPFEKVD